MAFPYLHDLLEALTGLSVPLPLPTFGACVLIAILAAVWVARSELLRMQRAGQLEWAPATSLATSGPRPVTPAWPAEVAWELASVVVIAGLVGARLASILEVPRAFLADPWGMIFSREGFNFLGGLALGAGAGAWYKHPFRPGWLFSLYLVLCGAERLLIEPIRVNPRAHVLGITASQAQIISAALVVIGIAALAALTRHPRRRLVPQPAGDPLEH